jgi:AcrR family transcriptional regulator
MNANTANAIKPDHREDILQAAIEVFGHVGYAAASTNEIVRQAKVSKGLLFHHFTSKEKLYMACQLYMMEEYGRFMLARLNFTSADFFERILYSLRVKMEFGRKNPKFLALINRAWYMEGENDPLKASEDIIKEAAKLTIETFFEGVDTSRFREGLPMVKVIDYTRLALEAGWARFSGRNGNDTEAILKNIDIFFTEAEEIISLLRDGAYGS